MSTVDVDKKTREKHLNQANTTGPKNTGGLHTRLERLVTVRTQRTESMSEEQNSKLKLWITAVNQNHTSDVQDKNENQNPDCSRRQSNGR